MFDINFLNDPTLQYCESNSRLIVEGENPDMSRYKVVVALDR